MVDKIMHAIARMVPGRIEPPLTNLMASGDQAVEFYCYDPAIVGQVSDVLTRPTFDDGSQGHSEGINTTIE
jgi:hypothetical protein